MTRTETIVRLLNSALAAQAGITLVRAPDPMGDCMVPVIIDGVLITFWMRNHLRRISEVTFGDGVTVDCAQLTAERWLPPGEEFGDWYRYMNGFECASVEEMRAEAARLNELRVANEERSDSVESLIRVVQSFNRYLEAEHRIVDGFNPFTYLTGKEQVQFEELLKKESQGKEHGKD